MEMENLEQAKEAISNYNKLIELAKAKIEVMEKIDCNAYNTARGIESINFYGDTSVSVTCDNSFRGCSDSFSFEFPLSYLFLSNGELKIVVEQDKVERLENERLQQQDKIQKDKAWQEKREREQFEKLKLKFGN